MFSLTQSLACTSNRNAVRTSWYHERRLHWKVSLLYFLTFPLLFTERSLSYFQALGACFLRFRLVSWFSYHLSNFQFRWSWEDWVESIGDDPLNPKAKFIQECLLKCMRYSSLQYTLQTYLYHDFNFVVVVFRLSYHQRIADIVSKCPEEFQAIAPLEPKPYFKFKSDDGNF